MSRRKSQWKQNVRRAGGADKLNEIMPMGATGRGEYLTQQTIDGRDEVKPGTGKGKTCTLPISTRKEQLVRQWAKS